jgi:hypothetical protein
MKQQIAIGHHDFEEIRLKNLCYVDKSDFIQRIYESQQKVFLFPRPRRFGKTLNMMLLRRYFEISEISKAPLFEGLKIKNWEKFDDHLGKYPVIWLSFKDVKQSNWGDTYEAIVHLLSREYKHHDYLLSSSVLDQSQKEYFNSIYTGTASVTDYQISIVSLCELLYLHHGVKPMLLIDEYDTPINNSYIYHFYEECIGFMRTLYSSCLKDNNFMERAVLTGIYRVAKESIFSGLNNLKVSTLLDDEFADCFGFTPEEVHQLLSDYNALESESDITRWYNGYIFGKEQVIYNPWSILSYLENTQRELKPYWVNTSSNDIIKKMIVEGDANIKQEIEVLLTGGTLRKSISEDVVFGNIQETPDALWNFFLFSGYLKVKNKVFNDEFQEGDFLIPNIEIKTIFKDSILYWFSKSQTYDRFNVVLENLKKGRLEDFEDYFEDFISRVCSYYDFADQEPERVYHALVLGMMVQLQSDYRITSNRESGFGRYDIVLHPLKKELPAYIFEFKKFNAKREASIDDSLNAAMLQMKTKNYAATLQQEGHTNIHLIAIAFKGKEVKMRYEQAVTINN